MKREDKWNIHNKLEEANQLIANELYKTKSEDEQVELLQMSMQIDKMMSHLIKE